MNTPAQISFAGQTCRPQFIHSIFSEMSHRPALKIDTWLSHQARVGETCFSVNCTTIHPMTQDRNLNFSLAHDIKLITKAVS